MSQPPDRVLEYGAILKQESRPFCVACLPAWGKEGGLCEPQQHGPIRFAQPGMATRPALRTGEPKRLLCTNSCPQPIVIVARYTNTNSHLALVPYQTPHLGRRDWGGCGTLVLGSLRGERKTSD